MNGEKRICCSVVTTDRPVHHVKHQRRVMTMSSFIPKTKQRNKKRRKKSKTNNSTKKRMNRTRIKEITSDEDNNKRMLVKQKPKREKKKRMPCAMSHRCVSWPTVMTVSFIFDRHIHLVNCNNHLYNHHPI
jgi:hypothetical protein